MNETNQQSDKQTLGRQTQSPDAVDEFIDLLAMLHAVDTCSSNPTSTKELWSLESSANEGVLINRRRSFESNWIGLSFRPHTVPGTTGTFNNTDV
jgi:hypothetical protein